MRFTLAAALISAAALAGCTAQPHRFAGISFNSADVAPEIRDLARRAAAGDKMAQLELGIRYEQGRGVPVNWRRAADLYEQAATTTGGSSIMVVPPIRRSAGTAVPVSLGPWSPGLPAARARLDALRERRRAEAARSRG